MPTYFLHIRDGETLIEDFEGQTFADLAAARHEAAETAREMLADRIRRGLLVNGQRIEICDEGGSLVGVVRYDEQFTVPPKR